MVYFAQFNLNTDAVAMVTASHNENGWTGVKMGIKKGLTHAPEEMKELKDITLNQKFTEGNGSEKQINNFQEIYKKDLIDKINKNPLKRALRCDKMTIAAFASILKLYNDTETAIKEIVRSCFKRIRSFTSRISKLPGIRT